MITRKERNPINVKYFLNYFLKDKIKNVKFSVLNTLYRNWENIVGQKYLKYCYPSKINLNQDQKQGILYITSYNPATSFFINNNKLYVQDKINTYFGYNAIKNIFIVENPMKIEESYIRKQKKELNDIEKNAIENINSEKNDKLSIALRDLTKSYYEYES